MSNIIRIEMFVAICSISHYEIIHLAATGCNLNVRQKK